MQKEFYEKYFKGRRITKQGFGILGRGYGVVKFLIDAGADIVVTDMKPREYFTNQIDEIERYIRENKLNNKIQWIFGEHRMQDFEKENCDFVIQASGVPKNNIYLNNAKEFDIKVYQEGSLFCDIVRDFNNDKVESDKIKIIGITGTRGKTTTTFIIYEILKNYFGIDSVYLGGNVQGVATLELLKKVKQGDFVVMELDSWVLQGFADIKFSPNISVFTNFMPDHMNYYRNDMQDYFMDKAAIFLNQKSNSEWSDALFTTTEMKNVIEKYLGKDLFDNFYSEESKKVFVTSNDIEQDKNDLQSKLVGEHNRVYISLAKRVSEYLKIDEDSIKNSIENFSGVAGRLENIKTIDEVSFINDTTATTGDAGMIALETFKDKNIILITGGRDKELDMNNYVNKIIDFKNKNIIKKVILLSDDTTTGTKKLIDLFKEKSFVDYLEAVNLKEAVWAARSAAHQGDIVLFSPAFASFGMFENEYDRGEKFNVVVHDLK